MWDWLLGNRGVKQAAAVIHQICHMGRHANATFGPKGAVGVFKRHPLLTSQIAPSQNGDPHQFRFQAPLEPFEFLAYDKENNIQVMGSGDFAGLTVTTTERGYVLFITQPPNQPIGRKARALAKELTRIYGALDTSEYVDRGIR